MPAAQRTAWEAYLTVTHGLLPVVDDEATHPATANWDLDVCVVRIERHALLWGEHGPMLLAALHGVQALQRSGDRTDLAGLLRAIADRLYLISAGPRPPRCDGHDRSPRNMGAYHSGPPDRRGDRHW